MALEKLSKLKKRNIIKIFSRKLTRVFLFKRKSSNEIKKEVLHVYSNLYSGSP